MKRLIFWISVVVTLLIVATMVKTLKVGAQSIVGVNQAGRCFPSEVYFKADKGQGDAYGCAIVRNDTLIIFTLLIAQIPMQAIMVPKANIDSIVMLRPIQTAVMKGGQRDPP